MSNETTIALPGTCTLPTGYRWGAHWNEPGSSGWYILRDSDNAAIQAAARPDYTEVEEDEIDPDYNGGHVYLTADEVAERIEEAFADADETRRVRLDLVLVETIPASDRASHAAAGNSGRYPANGARRFLVPRAAAEDLIGDWTEIVRDSRPADIGEYPIDITGEQTAAA